MKLGGCNVRGGLKTPWAEPAVHATAGAGPQATQPMPAFVPPMRDGVSASRVAVGDGRFACVQDFLVARFPAVTDWPARLARGEVLNAQGQALLPHSACTLGMLIWYWRSVPSEPRVPFEIELLHQDEHLVVVDKPHFLSVNPGGRHVQETVLVRLKQRLGIDSLSPMHRLDRETAGVLVFTVQPATRHAYQTLLRERQVHKVYEAVAPRRSSLSLPLSLHNRLEPKPGSLMQMQVVDGEPNALTHLELIGLLDAVPGAGEAGPNSVAATAHTPVCARTVSEGWAHYRLTPVTGRKHQLRVQMSALGLPICGDRIYPQLQPEPAPGVAQDYSSPLQLLAREMRFTDPISGQPRCFVSRRQLQLAAVPGSLGRLRT